MTSTVARIVSFALVALCVVVSTARAASPFSGVINLNTATAEELQLLPGVGPSKAKLILDYRRARPFRTVEELVRVKGIGRKTIVRLRPHLTVTGTTTTNAAATPPPATSPAAAGKPRAAHAGPGCACPCP